MELFGKYRPALQARVDETVSDIFRNTNTINKSVIRGEFLNSFVQNGKLLRGCLVCYVYASLGKRKPTKGVVDAAAALELIHAGLLIQDDIMDQDEKRRGKPAIHKVYESFAKNKGFKNYKRFGENMAICASDILIFSAFGKLVKSSPDIGVVNSLQEAFTDALEKVCEGQMLDIYLASLDAEPKRREILNLMQAKTASYSLALPLLAGAILSKASPAMQDSLYRLGMDVGVIFQIRDDELGILGNSQKTGKPVGADIRENKKTLLRHYLFEMCMSGEQKKLKSIFGNLAASNKDIVYVKKLIRHYKIPGLISSEISRLQDSSFSTIDKMKLDNKTNEGLKQLVRFCASRQL